MRNRIVLALALALALPLAGEARAEEAALPSPLKPDDVLVFARAHRAEIAAAKSKSDAAKQTSKVVSALPDPMIMAAIDHLPFKLDGADWSVQIQQDFPLNGSLGAKGRAAEAESRAVAADAKKVELDVEYQALGAYIEWIELQRMAVVVDEQLALARQIQAVAKVRLSVSEAAAADVIRAQADVARLEGERKALDGEIAAARSMLNANLGRAVDAKVPDADLVLPSAEPPSSVELAKGAIERRPEVVAMKARVDKARENVAAMDAMYGPMAFVRGGYAYRMDEGKGLMLMVGVTVPIWREKLSAGVSEAKSMTSMAESDVAAMSKMIEGEVAVAREQVVAARTRLATTREKVLPLAKQALSLTITTYGSGQTPLVSVLDGMRLLRDTRMEEVIAEMKLAAAWARLGRAVGVVKVGVP
jgi:outer membrane protein TolC